MASSTAAPNLAALLAALQSTITYSTQLAAQLPDPSDLQFEKTLSRSFAKKMNQEADNVLQLVNSLLNWIEDTSGKELIDGEMVREGVYADVVERIEPLLEGADDGIEKFLGIGKTIPSTVVAALSSVGVSALPSVKPPLAPHLLHSPNLARPQLLFTSRTILPRPLLSLDPLEAEAERVLWKPILTEKQHALDANAIWLRTEEVIPVPEVSRWSEVARLRYVHPYADELAALTPPASYYLTPDVPAPAESSSFQKTPFSWVHNLTSFDAMVDDIRTIGKEFEEAGRGKELAIDLEHHDYRSWGGMTCLIQVIDVLRCYLLSLLYFVTIPDVQTCCSDLTVEYEKG